MPSPDSRVHGIPLFGHLMKKKKKKDEKGRWEEPLSPGDHKATSVYFTSFQRHFAMRWTRSVPLTCHCALRRESARYKSSTVERLPWQLVELVSMLQRVSGGEKPYYFFLLTEKPHRRGQSKVQVSALHLRTTAPYLQLLYPVMCQTVWGWEEWSRSVQL